MFIFTSQSEFNTHDLHLETPNIPVRVHRSDDALALWKICSSTQLYLHFRIAFILVQCGKKQNACWNFLKKIGEKGGNMMRNKKKKKGTEK